MEVKLVPHLFQLLNQRTEDLKSNLKTLICYRDYELLLFGPKRCVKEKLGQNDPKHPFLKYILYISVNLGPRI